MTLLERSAYLDARLCRIERMTGLITATNGLCSFPNYSENVIFVTPSCYLLRCNTAVKRYLYIGLQYINHIHRCTLLYIVAHAPMSIRLIILLLVSTGIHALALYVPTFGRGSDGTTTKLAASTPSNRPGFSMVSLPAEDTPNLLETAAPPTPALAETATVPAPLAAGEPTEVTAAPIPPPPKPDEIAPPPKLADTATPSVSKGSSMLPMEGKAFFPTSALTKLPQPTVYIELNPADKPWGLVEGKIIITLWINEQGRVVDTQVEANELPPAVGEFVVSAFTKTGFVPGQRLGKVVGTIMRVEVQYDDLSNGLNGANSAANPNPELQNLRDQPGDALKPVSAPASAEKPALPAKPAALEKPATAPR